MAKEKDTPNLPGSSRMQMPSTGSGSSSTNGLIKETGGMASGSKGTSKRILGAASKTGMKGSNPYGKIC